MYKLKEKDFFFHGSLDTKLDIRLIRLSYKTTKITNTGKAQELVKNLRKQFLAAMKTICCTRKTEYCFIGPYWNKKGFHII